MKLILIAAVSVDGVIGIDDNIPWHIPEDMKHFRNTTINHSIIVGYNTYLTLPPKAFENRSYWVLSSKNKIVDRQNIIQFKTIDNIFENLKKCNNCDKIFVAGGAMIYDSMIDYCDEAIITWVNKKIPNGNKFFPVLKLFNNFVPTINDVDWLLSTTNIEYKIIQYNKINI